MLSSRALFATPSSHRSKTGTQAQPPRELKPATTEARNTSRCLSRWSQRFSLCLFFAILLFVAMLWCVPTFAQDGPVPVAGFKAHLDAAEQAFRGNDLEKTAEHVREAIAELERVLQATDRAEVAEIRAQHKRLVTAHRWLRQQRVQLPSLPQLRFNYVEATEASGEAMNAGLDFAQAVAPIIAQKCGRCHVSRANGGISLATTPDITAHVFPGDSQRSLLYELVANDTMPPGNNAKLTPAEKESIKTWIDQGAKVGTGQEALDLRTLLQPANRGANMPEIARATDQDSVFFSRDIAPLLVESCQGCHLQANNLRGGLSLDNFTRLLRGGDSGSMIVPGRPDESLLIRKLSGTADGQRMPINRPKWTEEQIELISTWIKEGARYDSEDPSESTQTVAKRGELSIMSTDAVNEYRADLQLKQWRLALVNQPFTEGETSHFRWMASTSLAEERRDNWLRQLESAFEARQETLLPATSEGYAAGKILVFFPGSNYDFSEFSKMVSKRDIGTRLRGYWDQSLDGPYLVMASSLDDAEVETELGQWVGAAMVANSAPDIPSWFCDSVAASADVQRRGVGAKALETLTPQNLQLWLEGRVDPALKSAIDQAVGAGWRKQSRILNPWLEKLRAGKSFRSLLEEHAAGNAADLATRLIQAGR